jgi:hypothetical protein
VFAEILTQLKQGAPGSSEVESLISALQKSPELNERQFDQMVPKIRRALAPIAERSGRAVIFLDDLHVLDASLQPVLLSRLYSVCRDNRIFLKVSGIEHLTSNWDPSARRGLETPHDAQIITLDYNLTMPSKSLAHIVSILNAHARYCALPNIQYICGNGVLERLVWVAAGVPRDALSILSTAIARATLRDQQKVSITSVNEAASETADEKISDIAKDASGRLEEVKATFDIVRKFCVEQKRTNAFLMELENKTNVSRNIRELIALRLLHVLHEGVTPHEAGRRYMALMLDYGFYVGIRAARSVELFQTEPQQISAKDLRRLPIFPSEFADLGGGN